MFCLSRFLGGLFLIVSLILLIPFAASAGVTVYDDVAVTGSSIMLKAMTGHRFLREGGELVMFELDEQHLGQTLSGGDGMAYFEYIPQKQGLFNLNAQSADDRDEGLLLVLSEKSSVVLVEIDEGLSESSIALSPRPESVTVIKEMTESFSVIYISKGLLGKKIPEVVKR